MDVSMASVLSVGWQVQGLGLLLHLGEQFLEVRLAPLGRQLAGEGAVEHSGEERLDVAIGFCTLFKNAGGTATQVNEVLLLSEWRQQDQKSSDVNQTDICACSLDFSTVQLGLGSGREQKRTKIFGQ
jgi:hypothetical protein